MTLRTNTRARKKSTDLGTRLSQSTCERVHASIPHQHLAATTMRPCHLDASLVFKLKVLQPHPGRQIVTAPAEVAWCSCRGFPSRRLAKGCRPRNLAPPKDRGRHLTPLYSWPHGSYACELESSLVPSRDRLGKL